MDEEEKELYPLAKLAYERRMQYGESVVIEEHTDIPENLLLAIINSIHILKMKRKEMALSSLSNKLNAFYRELDNHSAIEEELFQLNIK